MAEFIPIERSPGYWMNETSGVLRPAVEAYLNNEPLTEAQIAAMRAYLRQWIMSDVWDANPHADAAERAWLAAMRLACDSLLTRAAIEAWVDAVTAAGMDPL